MNSFFDRLLPNFLMKLECTVQRPAVFKRVKAARRHSGADRHRCFRADLHPHLVSCIVERGNRCRRGFPGNRTTPYQASASRPEHPLVASRYEEIAAQLREGGAVHAQAVDSVHTEQHAVSLVSLSVDRPERVGHCTKRELYAGAGVHPGYSQHAGLRCNRPCHSINDLIHGLIGGILIQGNSAD